MIFFNFLFIYFFVCLFVQFRHRVSPSVVRFCAKEVKKGVLVVQAFVHCDGTSVVGI
uniref:Uncharacterized protein n=1 Tax=Trypanosoma brucei TaxID=5691 RepID=Q581J3_9TRYP|nr:hypothetical protein, unlikely [Trypanosoma brucei]